MSNLIEIEIAGIRVELEIPHAAMSGRVRERYAEFIVADDRPHTRVRVEVNAGARFLSPRPGPWAIETYLDGNHLIYRSYRDAGWVNLDRGSGLLQLAPEAEIENFLRVLYAHLCLRAGGLLLHAAGVLCQSAGYVFFGASGSGKTTVAHLALDLGHTIVSDDLVILRQRGETWHVFGVPFRGDLWQAPRANAVGALAGLWSLVKDSQHYTVATPSSRAVSQVAACVPFVTSNPVNAQRVVHLCADLVAQVPVRELHFCRDAGFWSVLNEME